MAEPPDLIAVQFEWHVGPAGSVGKREQFSELKIPTYISPSDCVAKDNTVGGDGVRKEMFTMDLVYQEILDLARIFDVNDRGEKLVADLRACEASAAAKVAEADERSPRRYHAAAAIRTGPDAAASHPALGGCRICGSRICVAWAHRTGAAGNGRLAQQAQNVRLPPICA